MQNAARARGEKIRELFAFFVLVPEQNDEGENSVDEFSANTPLPGISKGETRRESTRRTTPFFRTITGLPLPISGRYGNMPPEVAAAAMGKIIHLLQCLIKYLKVTYPHPMVFNGSFSTIGNTSEGAGCHTLYPDGSPGFARAVEMLHENVSFLCSTQGVSATAVHATDVLGNLLAMYQSPRLGTLCDTVAPMVPKRCVRSLSISKTNAVSIRPDSHATTFATAAHRLHKHWHHQQNPLAPRKCSTGVSRSSLTTRRVRKRIQSITASYSGVASLLPASS